MKMKFRCIANTKLNSTSTIVQDLDTQQQGKLEAVLQVGMARGQVRVVASPWMRIETGSEKTHLEYLWVARYPFRYPCAIRGGFTHRYPQVRTFLSYLLASVPSKTAG